MSATQDWIQTTTARLGQITFAALCCCIANYVLFFFMQGKHTISPTRIFVLVTVALLASIHKFSSDRFSSLHLSHRSYLFYALISVSFVSPLVTSIYELVVSKAMGPLNQVLLVLQSVALLGCITYAIILTILHKRYGPSVPSYQWVDVDDEAGNSVPLKDLKPIDHHDLPDLKPIDHRDLPIMKMSIPNHSKLAWRPSFPGEPRPGTIYFGLSSSASSAEQREYQLGCKLSLRRTYSQSNDTVTEIIAEIQRSLAGGRLPIHSVKTPTTNWIDVANGSQDQWIQELTDGMKALKKPIWFCIHHEPYDDRVGGKGWNGNPYQTEATYRAMYDHVAHWTKGSNIALMPILQSSPFAPSVGGHLDATVWISDSADLIGMDAYNHWYDTSPKRWREPGVCFGDAIDAVARLGKKVAICEYGVRTDKSQPGRSAQWLRDAKSYLISRGAVGMSYFDSDQHLDSGSPVWILDQAGVPPTVLHETPANGFVDGPERLKAFQQLLVDSRTARLED